jgi:putative ABC transport system substrate-binding protein
VGPGAVRFVWDALGQAGIQKMIYTMVLNPENIIDTQMALCGIPLNIPLTNQLRQISEALPGIERLGLLYDPKHNAEFFAEAAHEAYQLGIKLIPLRVSDRKGIPMVLEKHWDKIHALWLIPDRTVISESIVQYLIKEGLYKKVPTIGYNRFFYESGAALAFVFDYGELGAQTGEKVLRMMQKGPCGWNPPIFHAWLNFKILKKLNIEPPDIKGTLLEKGP